MAADNITTVQSLIKQSQENFDLNLMRSIINSHNAEELDTTFREFDNNCHSLVEAAAREGNVAALTYFIKDLGFAIYEDGADVSLHLAASNNHTDALEYLINRCKEADITPLAEDLDGLYPHQLNGLTPEIQHVFIDNEYYQSFIQDLAYNGEETTGSSSYSADHGNATTASRDMSPNPPQ